MTVWSTSFFRFVRGLVITTLAVLVSGCSDGTSPLSPPTLTSIAPSSGVRGTTVVVNMTGTNFLDGLTSVHLGSYGITVSTVQVLSPTSLNAVLVIGEEAELGPREIKVSTVGGSSEPLTFTVEATVPTLQSITPNSGVRGTTVPVTLSGRQFLPGATQLNISGTGVTVSDVQSTESSVAATLTIAADAELGDREVTVTTTGGTSAPRTFTVRPPAPTLTALSNPSIPAGTSVTQTLTGTNFVSGATVSVSGGGVTVSNVQVVDATTITATFQVAPGAIVGNRNVTVTTSGGTSNPVVFTIAPALPTLTSLGTTQAMAGAIINQTLTGTNFLPNATVTIDGTGVTIEDVEVVSATRIDARFTVHTAAAPGPRNVRVVTSSGTSNARTFTVLGQAPSLVSATPSQIARGGTTPVKLIGTGFVVDGTTVEVSGDGVTVGGVDVTSGTELTVQITVAANATLGARDVTVETSEGVTAPITLTIIEPPSIVSFTATPSSVTSGQQVQLSWVTDNATECFIDNGVGDVPCNGSTMVTPTTNTTYNLRASGGGRTVVRAVTVVVTP